MSLTVPILRMFKATTTATMNLIWHGTNFHRITRRFWPGSTNGYTAWKIMPPTCANTDKLTLISSSRGLCLPRRLTMEGIDERRNLYGFGDDGLNGRGGLERGADCFRRCRSAQYRLQPGAVHSRA